MISDRSFRAEYFRLRRAPGRTKSASHRFVEWEALPWDRLLVRVRLMLSSGSRTPDSSTEDSGPRPKLGWSLESLRASVRVNLSKAACRRPEFPEEVVRPGAPCLPLEPIELGYPGRGRLVGRSGTRNGGPGADHGVRGGLEVGSADPLDADLVLGGC